MERILGQGKKEGNFHDYQRRRPCFGEAKKLMPYWENNDGTFEYSLLVTSGERNHASVDNPENQGTGTGTRTEKEDTTSPSGVRTNAAEATTQNDRW